MSEKRQSYSPKARDEIARNMAAIRSTENKTETALRKELFSLGLRYRKYKAGLPGRPDIVFPKEKVAVFVDGDYWHGRLLREQGLDAVRQYYTSAQRTYWISKLERNVARDSAVTTELEHLGWHVMRFWESDVRRNINATARRVYKAVKKRRG